jgi:mannose-6-phosphate isomerase
MTNFGGNLVDTHSFPALRNLVFSAEIYSYNYLSINKNSILELNDFKSACVFLLSGKISFENEILENEGDTLQLENKKIKLFGLAERSELLLVGSEKSFFENQDIKFSTIEQLKKVTKPWGFEIWITNEHPGYCLKKIFIKKGMKTSLQYHNLKRETNVLFDGVARLHYKKSTDIPNDNVNSQDISYHDLKQLSTVDISPRILHRLEALTDILLYEASTPHLDDVVRVKDDTNRTHGRVESEHE